METGQREEYPFKKYPFKVSVDRKLDWDSVFVRLEFSDTVSQEKRKKLKDRFEEWAEKGREGEYEEGRKYFLDDKPEWDEEGKWAEFFVDMTYSSEKSLEALFDKLANFGGIEEIKVGGVYD